MTKLTKEDLLSYFKKYGAEKVDSITDAQSAINHFRVQSQFYKEQRDEYKKQRDELIEDIAEVKKKAKTFDKLVEFYPQKDEIPSDEFFDEMGYIIKESVDDEKVKFGMELNNKILWRMTLMNNREQIEQSVISASAYNGNDTEGLLKEIEDVYKKAQAFDEILEGLPNAMQDALKEDIGLDEAVGIMTGQVVYKYEEEQEND
ncbi:Phage protein [Staphylococcus aureus]|nr:phage protein [Staphylococcus aureus]CFF98587.1 phage protein [Staphylococcus aureus]COY10674.1 phage protein [Staphylococcus aureus]COY11355.1 phage protein [Staphylococcus aureus]COZ95516.1 phage protein [Staphylococcus aureus]